MTFIEQYSLAMTRFFKENSDNKERLKEMIYWMYNPGPGSILATESGQELVVGGCKFIILRIKEEWVIKIRDESNKQIGELEFKDQFLVYSDDLTNRVIAIEHQNGIISDINLYHILLDNY